MQEQVSLSKEELVEALHERGYINVNIGQVTDWRHRDLLPPFDLQGVWRGRCQGRDQSAPHLAAPSIRPNS
jgi:hypothetical protein